MIENNFIFFSLKKKENIFFIFFYLTINLNTTFNVYRRNCPDIYAYKNKILTNRIRSLYIYLLSKWSLKSVTSYKTCIFSLL